MTLSKWLRRNFSDNVIFYYLYYYFKMRPRKKGKRLHDDVLLGSSKINYYLDGYERSGNTYLKYLIKNIFPHIRGLSHLHRLAPLKLMLLRGTPSIILMRDPMECISSNYLKHFSNGILPKTVDKEVLEMRLDDYVRYYNFVRLNIKKIHLIPFNKLVNNKVATIIGIQEFLNLPAIDELEEKITALTNQFKQDGGAKEVYGTSQPSKLKEVEKDKVKDILVTLPATSRARQIYKEICQKQGTLIP